MASFVTSITASSAFPSATLSVASYALSSAAQSTTASSTASITPNTIAAVASQACRALEYGGNSDIGGIGIYIAYGSISFVSMFFALFAMFHYHVHDPDKKKKNLPSEKFRKDCFKTSLMFWDTVVWFGILGSAAAIAGVHWNMLETIYETILMLTVASLGVNATVLLALLYVYPDAREEENHKFRVATQIIALLSGLVMVIFGALIVMNWNNSVGDLKDFVCYIVSDNWPRSYLQIVVGEQIILLVVIIVYLFFIEGFQSEWRHQSWMLSAIGVLSIAAIVTDFIIIHFTRFKAKEAFGPTYSDDNWSYGQIVASGLAVQAAVFFLWSLFKLARRSIGSYDSVSNDY